MDSVIICIYLRSQPKFFKKTTEGRFPDQGNVRHNSKLWK